MSGTVVLLQFGAHVYICGLSVSPMNDVVVCSLCCKWSHVYVHGLWCHPGPCTAFAAVEALLIFMVYVTTRGHVWVHGPSVAGGNLSLKSMWMLALCAVTWSHIDVHRLGCHWRPCWGPWHELTLEVRCTSTFCVVDTIRNSLNHVLVDWKGQGSFFCSGMDNWIKIRLRERWKVL